MLIVDRAGWPCHVHVDRSVEPGCDDEVWERPMCASEIEVEMDVVDCSGGLMNEDQMRVNGGRWWCCCRLNLDF